MWIFFASSAHCPVLSRAPIGVQGEGCPPKPSSVHTQLFSVSTSVRFESLGTEVRDPGLKTHV